MNPTVPIVLMSHIEFNAPGPGTWELEQTPSGGPATGYMSTLISEPMSRGLADSAKRYGLLIDTFRMRFVNDFCYGKIVPVGAPEDASGGGLPPRWLFTL